MCKELGIELMIDDHMSVAQDARERGLRFS